MRANDRGSLSAMAALLVTAYIALPAFSQLVPAAERVDMVYDDLRGILYISNGGELIRYRIGDQTKLASITLGSTLMGMDISPDGSTLAVADSTYTDSENHIFLLDVDSGSVTTVTFSRAYGEGGTFSVAWGSDHTLLVTTQFLGWGTVPMRHYDPSSGVTTVLPNVKQDSMLAASADRSVIGFAGSRVSGGPVGRYRVLDRSILLGATNDFGYEVGVNHDGTQFAFPTLEQCYIFDAALQPMTTLGTRYAPLPIGVVYHPTEDLVYLTWAETSEVRAHETSSFSVVDTYNTGTVFVEPGASAYKRGRLKIAGNGETLFCAVRDGVLVISLINNAPIAGDDPKAGEIDADQVLVATSSLLANDFDIDVDDHLIVVNYDAFSAHSASVVVNLDGTFSYDPTASDSLGALPPGERVVDSFTYTVSDGVLTSVGTVGVIVHGADPSPPALPALGTPLKALLVVMLVLAASYSAHPTGLRYPH